MTRLRMFAAPLRYIQGPGALDALPGVLAPYGEHPLVVTDPYVRELLGARVAGVLSEAGLAPAVLELPGEITAAAADELAASAGAAGAGIVVGIGGGKALDAAKAVSLRLGLPVVTVPSVASNDSPTSAAIAMYDGAHRLVAVDRLPANPHAVVVDTALVAAAPVAFLRSGIGDAVAKKFEAAACRAGTGVTALGTRPLAIGSVLADACYDVLQASAVAGLAACERGAVDDALEAVVEAVVLLSGLGFENGGLSLAHSLTRGLMRARGAREAMHGEQVAWATLVQRVAEGAPAAEVAELRGFLVGVGLPTGLAQLGMPAPTAEEVRDIARITMTAPHLANLTVPATEELVAGAILAVEALG
ncbi:glycerol dehydrogenase [Blastococcus sp. PRF04-17]|uniref:glycerol dehydrogenase n=1 Tax=Blastococcus sp. PRF04-17 TaxID=2933797 RepID=UPI001FF1BE60|nr:glycerol dehydrogenase [Blastococcus sp. PRF04-17]UOY02611.1 glycerol dehydrogenase [Blastococcus sp. PRF04-17]